MKKIRVGKKITTLLVAFVITFSLGLFSMQNATGVKAAGDVLTYSLAVSDDVQLTELGGASEITNSVNGPDKTKTAISTIEKGAPTLNPDGSYTFNFNEWGYAISTAFNFAEPIQADSVNGLAFKIKLTENQTYSKDNTDGSKMGYGYYNIRQWGMNNKFFWDSVGIHILGAENTGDKSILLDPFFELSDGTSWGNLIIKGDDLVKLADADGYISGFRLAGGFCHAFFGLRGYPIITVGEIKTVEFATITYKDGDKVLKTSQSAIGLEGVENYKPTKIGYSFIGWETEVGADFTDFTSPVTADLTLVAKFEPGNTINEYRIIDAVTATFDGSKTITGIDGDNAMGGYEDPTQAFNIANKNSDVDTSSGYLTYPIHNWGYCIYKVSMFTTPVKADEIDALSFRVKAHLSSSSTYGGWDGAKFANEAEGIWFLGADSLGEKGDGILLDPYIKQDEWIYLTFSGDELLKLADADGYIRGFRVAASTIDGTGTGQAVYNPVGGVLQANIMIDEVIVNISRTITYKDGSNTLKTENGFSFVSQVDYVPTKEGYVFCGWLDTQYNFVPLGTPVKASNLTLRADFKALANAEKLNQDAGLYKINGGDYNDKYIDLFSDGEVILPEGMQSPFDCQYASNGKVYAYCGQSLVSFDLSACTKVEHWTVTYDYGDLGYTKRAMIERGSVAKQPTFEGDGIEILRWSLDYKLGTAYDFTTVPTGDVTLYAITTSSASRYFISGGENGFSESASTLNAINGITSINNYNVIIKRGLNSVKLDSTMSVGSDDGYAFRAHLGGWGIFLTTAIEFDRKIPVSELDGLTFRIWAHLSPRENYSAFYASGQGYRIYGIGADGNSSGVLIPTNIKQDQWTDLVLSKSEVQMLADKQGYFSGFMLASGVMVDGSAECNGYGGAAMEFYSSSPYILVDSVSANYSKKVTYYDDSTVLSEQTMLSGDKFPNDYFPTKQDKAFTGWSLYGEAYNGETVYQSMPLIANWVDSVEIPRGIYTKGGEEFTIYENGIIDIPQDDNYSGYISYSCLLGSDGILYVYNTDDGLQKINLSEWSRQEICAVTIKDGDKTTLTYVLKGSLLDGTELNKDGYRFNGYSTVSGAFDLSTPVTQDLELDVNWTPNEISQTEYAEYIGKYYDPVSKTFITLSNNNVAIYNEQQVSYQILINGEIIIGDVVGTALGEYIQLGTSAYDKLAESTVSFYSNGGSAVDKQTVTPDSPYAVRPTDPTRTGYRFLGWTTEKNGDVYYDFESVVTGSIEIYAKWEKLSNGGSTGGGSSSGGSSGGDVVVAGGCGGNVTSSTPIIFIMAIMVCFVAVMRRKARK